MPSEVERRGFWREPGGEPTSRTIAFEAWALAAREILTETAQTYHATILDTDLAEAVQVRTNIRTSQGNWLGTVLLPVIHLCHREDEPPLTSLVLQSRDGMVGEGYDEVLRVEEQRPITDPAKREHHAAVSRLECYRWAGSAPADGGEVRLPTPTVAAEGATRTLDPVCGDRVDHTRQRRRSRLLPSGWPCPTGRSRSAPRASWPFLPRASATTAARRLPARPPACSSSGDRSAGSGRPS